MAPTPPALPGGSYLGHSYEYGLDVNLGTYASPVWQSVRRISNFQPSPTPKTQPAQSYDDFGADNADVVGWSVNLAFSAQVNRNTSTGLYLPEIEALLLRTKNSSKGDAAVIDVRWYHKPEVGVANPTDAGRGFFTVSQTRANTGPDGSVEVLNFTLTGKGPATDIANPFTGWGAAVPTISAATPSGVSVGNLVTITGTGFTGTIAATGVKFLAVNAPSFTVISDSTIVVAMPSGTAGSAPITVTNGTGASTTFPYTRGA